MKEKTFLALKLEWYAKLKEIGFKDIEYDDGQLERSIDERWQNYKNMKSQQDYYDIASDYLHNGKFDSEEEKYIWELFCNGGSVRKIAIKINTYRDKVHKILLKYRKRAGLYWKK